MTMRTEARSTVDNSPTLYICVTNIYVKQYNKTSMFMGENTNIVLYT